MNVSFIGCPCSGKTTTAAMIFARLKESCFSVELLPEYARLYIAKRRLARGLKPQDKLRLTDEDQMRILIEQSRMESTMAKVCGPQVVVISDTWSLATLLYMGKGIRKSKQIRKLVETDILPFIDLVFYVPPVAQQFLLDPNRIHDEKQSLAIDAQIPGILSEFAPRVPVIRLDGKPALRTSQALSEIFGKLNRHG